jgi:hypothetical protein
LVQLSDKYPYQDTVRSMNKNIHDMVACDTVSPEHVIQGESKVGDGPQRIESDNSQRIGQVFDGRVAGYIAEIIKEKRVKNGESVTYPHSQNEEGRKPDQVQLTALVVRCRGNFIYRLLH